MNTAGTYVDYVIPVCPHWPSITNPIKEEDAVRATQWGGATVVTPCEWRHDKAVENQLTGTPPKGHILIRIPLGMTRSWGAKQNLKYMFCKTHQAYATKTYVKNTGFQNAVETALTQWWEFKYEYLQNPNGYTSMKMRAYRKMLVDTMRKMW